MADKWFLAPKAAEVVVHKYGNADLSDVVFMVGMHQFHCHKMTLASRCGYFSAMFSLSGYQTKEQRVLNTNPTSFKHLMDIFYYNEIEEIDEVFRCNSHEGTGLTSAEYNQRIWRVVSNVTTLAQHFMMIDVVRHSIENALLRYHHRCPYDKGNCHHCAIKLVLAVRHNLNDYKMVSNVNRKTLMEALQHMKGYPNFSFDEVVCLLDRD